MNVVAWLVEGGCRLKLGSPPPRSPHHLIGPGFRLTWLLGADLPHLKGAWAIF